MNDIPPLRSRLVLGPEQMSRGTPPADAPRGDSRLKRLLQTAAAVSLVGIACFGLLREQLAISSNHAVISAATIPLRTPIGGTLTLIALDAGQTAADGTLLARVENHRADGRRLADARAERDRAAEEAAVLAGQIAALDGMAAGLGQAGPGGGDGTPRRDDVALWRAEMARLLAGQQAALRRADRQVAEEAARHAEEREALLQANGTWQPWRILASHGQRVAPEETVAELVDCHAAFLLAAVAQHDVPRVNLGQPVRLLLDGEPEARSGTVQGWLPDGMAREGGRLAALPTRPRGGSQIVQIGIAPAAPGHPCPVGRTGRVLFDRPGLRLPAL